MSSSNEEGATFRTLPGQSSIRLLFRGTVLLIGVGLLAFPTAFESKFGSAENIYIAVSASVGAILLVSGSVVSWFGYRKQRHEIECGYTPNIKIATANPDLYLVDFRTLQVVCRPYEPRPPLRSLRR